MSVLPFNITNPGFDLGGILTTPEAAFVTDLFSLSYANGDILYYNSGMQRLPKGTDGQILTLVTGLPAWAADAGISDGDKGDITVSVTGSVWTIDNGAVTLAKQADMATASLIYRKTAGSGTPEVQTLATLKTDLGLTGTNSGDNAVNTLYSGLVTNATHTGDATGSGALTVVALNGTNLAALGTGVLKNTTTTGVPFISKVAITEPATSATLTIANGKTLTANNTITLAGTDSTVMTFPSTSATIARTDAANTFTGVQTMTSPATTTSITTSSTSFTAWAGATTLLTIGGTGATASLFAPSTLDTTSSITGAIRTSGGISAAKAANIGTSLTVGTTIELGHATDTTLSRVSAGVVAVEGVTVPTISSTNTLTNKRVTPRTGTTTSSATPTINTDNVDFYSLTAQAVDITSFTTNLSGTPTEGQRLWIAVTGTAARAITWGASFENGPVALPTTTVTTTRLDVGFIWNTVTSKWRCVASGSTV